MAFVQASVGRTEVLVGPLRAVFGDEADIVGLRCIYIYMYAHWQGPFLRPRRSSTSQRLPYLRIGPVAGKIACRSLLQLA